MSYQAPEIILDKAAEACSAISKTTYERKTDLGNPIIELIWLEITFATSKNICFFTALLIQTQNGEDI